MELLGNQSEEFMDKITSDSVIISFFFYLLFFSSDPATSHPACLLE